MALTVLMKKHFLLTVVLVLCIGFVSGMYTERATSATEEVEDLIEDGVEGLKQGKPSGFVSSAASHTAKKKRDEVKKPSISSLYDILFRR